MKPEEMRARFHELTQQATAIQAKVKPLRVQHEAILRAHEQTVRPLERQIKALEAPLHEIDMERAALARALKGKTGEPTKG